MSLETPAMRYTQAAEMALSAGTYVAAALGSELLLPEHLLLGLLRVRGGRARLLLVACGVPVDALEKELEARRVGAPRRVALHSEAIQALLADAWKAARAAGNAAVRTDDLLLALTRRDGPLAQRLAELGVTQARAAVKRELLRKQPDRIQGPATEPIRPRGEVPRVVLLVQTLLLLQAIVGVSFGPLVTIAMADRTNGPWIVVFSVLGCLWSGGVATYAAQPFGNGDKGGWAVVMAGLLIKSTWLNGAATLLGPGARDLVSVLGILLLLVTVAVFRARSWFGVEPREGWRTVWQRAWWVLLVTGFLDFSILIPLAFR